MTSVAKLSLILLALLVLHVVDHSALHPGSAGGATSAVGLVGLAAVALLAGLALRRDARAPIGAAIIGFGTAVGFALVHIAPHWSALSDPYPGAGLTLVSWASMLTALVIGFALGLAGVAELRRATASAAAARGSP